MTPDQDEAMVLRGVHCDDPECVAEDGCDSYCQCLCHSWLRSFARIRSRFHAAEAEVRKYHKWHLEWREKFYAAEKRATAAEAELAERTQKDLDNCQCNSVSAAEAEVERLRTEDSRQLQQLHSDLLTTIKAKDKAEAEVERLRAGLEQLAARGHEIRDDLRDYDGCCEVPDIARALLQTKAPTPIARIARLTDAYRIAVRVSEEQADRATAAEEEVERLRAVLDKWLRWYDRFPGEGPPEDESRTLLQTEEEG